MDCTHRDPFYIGLNKQDEVTSQALILTSLLTLISSNRLAAAVRLAIVYALPYIESPELSVQSLPLRILYFALIIVLSCAAI